jgi:hypothetical protein
MTSEMQIVLAATPLAGYFYALCVFHGGKRPKMVSGPVDVGLLAFGLGGLVAFGPFGRAVLGRLVGEPAGPMAWTIWLGVVALWSLVLAGSASLRISVYHVGPKELERAIAEALGHVPGQFSPTLNGFEDTKRGVGLTLKTLSWLRSGGIVVYGREPEILIRELKPQLKAALARFPQRSSAVTHIMFGLACLAMLVPFSNVLLTNPRAKDALRALLHSLRWW